MIQFCYLLNVVLFSRLIFTFRDEPITRKQTAFIIIIQLFGLFAFELNFIFAVLALILIAINLLSYFFENKNEKVNFIRIVSFLSFVIVLNIFFAPQVSLQFNPHVLEFLQSLNRFSLVFSLLNNMDWLALSPILLGALLVTNETNIFIRSMFQVFTLTPEHEKEADQKLITIVDKREYNAGRIIGVLERLLIYYFVLINQFAAIGLIIAAKSFARFKDLEKREFAEYVLIGTLLSTMLAIFIAKVVQLL